MRNVRDLVRRKSGTNSGVPLRNLVPIPPIVAHEQAQTVNGGWDFLWAFGGLLRVLGGFWTAAWMAAQISWTHLNACCWANGSAHAKSAKNDT